MPAPLHAAADQPLTASCCARLPCQVEAFDESQKYKEGKFILERAHVVEEAALPPPPPLGGRSSGSSSAGRDSSSFDLNSEDYADHYF